ncbi:MAG: hypothetical protein HY077_06060 [Elusimicrobia bacterium]|nr:hypothetical protein [Elusimicrobiota bacterium]
MKRIALTAVVLAASLSNALGQSLEVLKSGGFEASFQFGLAHPAPPPPTVAGRFIIPRPGPAQTRSYQSGGYTWESDAQAARTQAENNLRAAGLSVLSAQVFRDSNFPFNYGLKVDYLAGYYIGAIQTYTGGSFTWESEAQAEVARTVANFRATGYKVILGQVKKQSNFPFNYFYDVDYLTAAAQPIRYEQVFTSQVYPTASTAKWAMDREAQVLRQKGCLVVSAQIMRSYNGFYFQIRYRRY